MKDELFARSRLLVPAGFRFSGTAAGLKGRAQPDLGFIEAPGGAMAAAVFTSNRVKAAPLRIGQRNLRAARGRLRAVLVNSGNANCATPTGEADGETTCRALARLLGSSPRAIFPASTGIIGVKLPVARIVRALPRLCAGSTSSSNGVRQFARAILTTDTRPKLAATRMKLAGKRVTLLGVAKGAGMIHPGLATMLVYLLTDAASSPPALQAILQRACRGTFNRISVDGDTSTNDTVLLMASGASGVRLAGRFRKQFQRAAEAVCRSLALQIVADGEGARRVARIRVEKARTEKDAARVAQAIARSLLVKTAWAGADPNWGRILAAVGASGVPLPGDRTDIFLGRQQVCRRGRARRFNERAAHRHLSRRFFDVRVRLHAGRAGTTYWSCDLTTDYVRINAHYRT